MRENPSKRPNLAAFAQVRHQRGLITPVSDLILDLHSGNPPLTTPAIKMSNLLSKIVEPLRPIEGDIQINNIGVGIKFPKE